MDPSGALRLGLCCTFRDVPVRFRHTTAAYVLRQPERERMPFLGGIVAHNASSLLQAIDWCAEHGVGAFRIHNALVPLATHPELGYRLEDLPPPLLDALAAAGEQARLRDIRLSFHPDQFVVLGSTREQVVRSSVTELDHLGRLADLLGAEQLTLHGGGAAGGKEVALDRLRRGLDLLPEPARRRLVLENDDRTWTVSDLLPFVRETGLALVYDVHHHRCNPDELSELDATELAAATWGGREPWTHLSSPLDGWQGGKVRHHAEHIDPDDVPEVWRGRAMTVDVEAKAKEVAVLALRDALACRGWRLRQGR